MMNELDTINGMSGGIDEWLDLISQYEKITELDRETASGLVESITVYEKIEQAIP